MQLEILRDELPEVDSQTRTDAKLGAYMQPLDLPGGLGQQIDTIRALYAAGETLPARLGRDDPRELNSDLALQTIARTLIVTLAALRGVNVTFGKAIGVLRAVLLPVTGITSRERNPAGGAQVHHPRRRITRLSLYNRPPKRPMGMG